MAVAYHLGSGRANLEASAAWHRRDMVLPKDAPLIPAQLLGCLPTSFPLSAAARARCVSCRRWHPPLSMSSRLLSWRRGATCAGQSTSCAGKAACLQHLLLGSFVGHRRLLAVVAAAQSPRPWSSFHSGDMPLPSFLTRTTSVPAPSPLSTVQHRPAWVHRRGRCPQRALAGRRQRQRQRRRTNRRPAAGRGWRAHRGCVLLCAAGASGADFAWAPSWRLQVRVWRLSIRGMQLVAANLRFVEEIKVIQACVRPTRHAGRPAGHGGSGAMHHCVPC